MQIHIIPVFSDNFSYLIISKASGKTAVVDPASPTDVISYCNQNNLSLPSIVLTTHRHADHSGGNKYFHDHFEDVVIVGGKGESVPFCNQEVNDGDEIKLDSIGIQVISSPCHTSGHVMYYINYDNDRCLFTGDTIFVAGCGRFFEGSAKEMLNNIKKIVSLPHDTKIYCGHEYTVANLEFARSVEPDNTDIWKKLEWAQQCRSQGNNTIPSTISEELTYNPFMRIEEPAVISYSGNQDPEKTLAILRNRKNRFG